ncbi:MAG: nucleotidyltransferase domain-containing protein [Candidatus Jettenia sp.]|nr:MAG: nucleotidyltransferase domain-containing protein [Candidatus Jettenia sp.]
MKEEDKEIVLEFKRRLTEDIRVQIEKVIVFGSRARGEGTEDSDLDVIVLVREKTPKIEKKLEDVAYSVMWDYDFRPIISLKVFSKSQFDEATAKGFSFYKHIQKEGISV